MDKANLAGRLHPSQRRQVLHGTFAGFAFLVLGVVCCALAPISPGPVAAPLAFAILLLAAGLWLAGRPVLEILLGKVAPVEGWTTVEARDAEQITYATAGGGSPNMRTRRADYLLNVGARTFKVDRDVYALARPDQKNTVFLLPLTKRVVNAVPERGGRR